MPTCTTTSQLSARHLLRRIGVSGFCVLILSMSVGCSKPPQWQTWAGDTGQFEDWRGEWVVINCWASWCKPCIEEIPELNELQTKAPFPLRVYAVNYDQVEGDKLRAEAEAIDLQFPSLTQDPSSQLAYQRPMALPTTVIISPRGDIVAELQGPQTADGLIEYINTLP